MAALTEEQNIIRDQAKAWVRDQQPVTKFREVRDSQEPLCYAQPTWQAMVEMGWTGILVPEEYGGSNLGFLTFGLILEELGRNLTPSPLFSSALLGAQALVLGGSETQKQTLLPKIVDGSEVLTLAVDDNSRHQPDNITTTAEQKNEGLVLNGQKTFVPDGMAATIIIVACKIGSDTALVLVPADADGVTRSPLQTMDSRGFAEITLNDVEVPGENMLSAILGQELLTQVLDCGRAGLGAEMMGLGAQAFDMTLEYLKTREQFGRVIGSFQALGHRAAELYSAMELSRSCAEAALQALDQDADDVAQLASLSKSQMSDFAHLMSNQLIQIHGGIGMTDEFDAGLYLKRARVLETLLGNASFHRDRYATLLGF